MPRGRPSWRVAAIAIVVLSLLVGGFFMRYEMPRIQLPAEPIFHVAGFAITNTLLATWLAMLTVTLFFRAASRNVQLIPSRLQNMAEIILEAFLGLCVSVAGERNGRKFFPLVVTIFLFALTANWMGLLPGYGTIGLIETGEHGTEFVPLLRGATTDLNTTVAMALISVVAIQVYGIRELGARAYLGRFFNFRGGPIGMVVGLLELISEFAKVISFSFRLFGNIFAGEVLLTVIAFLLPFVATIPFLGLEVFVGVVQAFVFAILTLVFLTVATTGHESHEAGAEHAQHAS